MLASQFAQMETNLKKPFHAEVISVSTQSFMRMQSFSQASSWVSPTSMQARILQHMLQLARRRHTRAHTDTRVCLLQAHLAHFGSHLLLFDGYEPDGAKAALSQDRPALNLRQEEVWPGPLIAPLQVLGLVLRYSRGFCRNDRSGRREMRAGGTGAAGLQCD